MRPRRRVVQTHEMRANGGLMGWPMSEPVEYDCVDCGRHVIAFGFDGVAEPGKRCASCDWIREHIQPEGAAEVREQLGVPLTTPLPAVGWSHSR